MYFLVEKKDSGFHPILALRGLNWLCILKLSIVIHAMQSLDIDLSDAYFHVLIAPEYSWFQSLILCPLYTAVGVLETHTGCPVSSDGHRRQGTAIFGPSLLTLWSSATLILKQSTKFIGLKLDSLRMIPTLSPNVWRPLFLLTIRYSQAAICGTGSCWVC